MSRSSGFSATPQAGDFFTEGSPTMPPQRFGTSSHESCDLGLMAQRAPMIDPRVTSTAAAMNSGGQGMRSASSMTQARKTSGSRVPASNVGTGFSSAMIGFGADHALLLTLEFISASDGALMRERIGQAGRPLRRLP